MKAWWKAAGIRAIKTVVETLSVTLPENIVITPAMIQHFDISWIFMAIAWLLTGLAAGGVSLLISLKGLPEVDDTKVYHKYE